MNQDIQLMDNQNMIQNLGKAKPLELMIQH